MRGFGNCRLTFIIAQFCLISGVDLWGQEVQAVSSASPLAMPVSALISQTATSQFMQAQEDLIEEWQNLVQQGASPEQLSAWRQQNAARFAAQQQLAQAMATAAAIQPEPTNLQPHLSVGGSSILGVFLTTQLGLNNARAQIHNQLVSSLPSNVTALQVNQLLQQEEQLFLQHYAGDLQAQAQRSVALAQSSTNTLAALPPPLVIPPETAPAMAAYLTSRDQLIRAQIQFRNRYVNAIPAEQTNALQQWRQQNAASLQQLQQATASAVSSEATSSN